MKRSLCLAIALCLLAVLFCGCGDKKDDKGKDTSGPVSSAPVVSKAPVSPAPVQKAKAAKVNADGGLNIRSEPSTDSEILGLAEDGSLLPLLVETASDGWYQVEYDGKTAYIYAEYAEVQEITLEQYNKLKTGTGTSSSDVSSSDSSQDEDPQRHTSSASSSEASSEASSSGQASSSQPSAVRNEDGE